MKTLFTGLVALAVVTGTMGMLHFSDVRRLAEARDRPDAAGAT
jgi:hypothetical protein